jgi:hypothetical protein
MGQSHRGLPTTAEMASALTAKGSSPVGTPAPDHFLSSFADETTMVLHDA